MFQDTLLIIKPNYLVKRKPLLLYLLQQGFFIKGQRKTCFTPELAAEFYQDRAEDPCFMFQVILLSKGNSEAFILAKECGVEELINAMVCYFCNSTEMEQNVHVTKCLNKVQREISFIYPNYIHEPIYCVEQIKFCANNPLVRTTISTLYDIVTNVEKDPHKSWKEKLAESLILVNKTLPRISNRCCYNLRLNVQDIGQQTKISCLNEKIMDNTIARCSHFDLSKDYSSINVTTSSCVSCSGFDSEAKCVQQFHQQSLEDIIKARTAPLNVRESSFSSSLGNVQEDVFAVLIKDNKLSDVQAKKVFDNEMFDMDLAQLHNKEDKLSVQMISMKSEESTLPDTEQNKEIIENISPLPEEIRAAMPYNEMSDVESVNPAVFSELIKDHDFSDVQPKKEDKPSVEMISMRSEETPFPDTEKNMGEIIEKISPLPEEIIAAMPYNEMSDVESVQLSNNLNKSLVEKISTKSEESILRAD